MAESYGWAGKILRVNLTTGEITTQDDEKYHKYIGGMGMAYRIMYEEAPMELDPYDEKALVIFGVGPLTGAGVPCSGRMNVTFRSTWSKGHSIIDAHMGGHIGSMLKYAGYDGIVVSGISEKPVYLRIEDGAVSLEDATEIWGKGTFAANKWMVEQNGREFETASIGPAGENLVDYFNLRNEQRSDWSGKAKMKCTVRDFEEVKRAVDYLKAHSLNTVEDLNQAIDSLNQTAAPLRKQLKQNENRMRAIAQIKDAAAVHAKLKPIHDIFIKKNFKLTKDAYAAQHKEELDIFNKAVRTLMKLNGSIAVDFSALDAEFSALQSSSAEFRTQLETLQPDISDLKSVRKYIDMVLNKQQLFAPGGKTPEKESVLKKLEQFQQKKSHHKTTSTPPNREESL